MSIKLLEENLTKEALEKFGASDSGKSLPFSNLADKLSKEKKKKKIKLAIVKSKLIKQLKKSYPNILVKDLEKITKIILEEIKKTLKRSERVE